uniref:NADH-ubiquinone oxidoreductase chain 2 n=1 Tax=Conotrachelus sp. KM-2017 TaxID=2219344 RepID=A0A346RFT5_9CUCU|nr:NADH dehydrogenase subunit 2 [Conotrachelus sp. KM-2017]
MMKLYKIMFFNSMILGTLISISSSSWILSWIGLEINLLSIIPLMKNYHSKSHSEASIKYFIIQAFSSALLLFSVIIFINLNIEFMNFFSSLLINTALLLKMGAAPFHFWLPEVISGLNWEMIFIVLTWQKIAPMILLSYTLYSPMFLSIIIILSSLIGGIQGINQMCLRKIMAYSSISHMSWMISALLNSASIWTCYFIIYSIINLNILIIFYKYNIYYIKQLSKLFSFNKKIKFMFMLNFLSLGGLPPFLGFFPKWMTMNFMIKNNFYTLALLLTIITLISLFFYLRMSFSSFTINSEESILINYKKVYYFNFMANMLSLMSLILCTIITNYF